MNIFKKLFGKIFTVQCPRCLGKGFVDTADITRLKQELRWLPGTCAYCDGKGRVSQEITEKVGADAAYLTTDLSSEERKKFINNELDALERARKMDSGIDTAIHQIIYLPFTCDLDAGKIADFHLLPNTNKLQQLATYQKEKEELIDYIERVIALKKNAELN